MFCVSEMTPERRRVYMFHALTRFVGGSHTATDEISSSSSPSSLAAAVPNRGTHVTSMTPPAW